MISINIKEFSKTADFFLKHGRYTKAPIKSKDWYEFWRDRGQISRWRERETENGIIYGQKFLTRGEILEQFPQFDLVPLIPELNLGDYSYRSISEGMNKSLPNTVAALSLNDHMRPEGIVLRNVDRSKIVKLRFEDYERTLRR